MTGIRVCLVAGLMALASCGNPGGSASESSSSAAESGSKPAPAGVLNVYSARHYDSDKAMYKAFEADTGIHVRFRESGAPELLETLKAEGTASPADVVISSDAGTLYRFEAAGLLQPLDSDVLKAAVPEHFRQADGYWYGFAKRARVIAYDPARVSPEDVDQYTDLADAKFHGEVCMRSSTNIYNLSLMGELIGRLGHDTAQAWARSVVENFARPPQGGDTTQIEAIAAGECSVALTNHYYYVRMTQGSDANRAAAAKVALSFPEQDGTGTHVNVTGAGLAAHAPNRDDAVTFLEWLATPAGQRWLTTETKEFPIVAGVDLPKGLEALPDFHQSDFPLEELGTHQAEAQEIYDLAGWN
ncbi:MAG: extracellular solute-binding protein [Hyphomonas sp.]|nr:extracellular solute-binding protein [Hyphomonas sp.]